MAYSTISAADFLALSQQQPNLCVIDVRTAAEYGNEYLAGSQNIPMHEVNSANIEAAGDAEHKYLLCGTGQRAQKVAEQLSEDELNCILIEGGIGALKGLGVTLNQGEGNVISLERQVRIAAGALVLSGVVLGTLYSSAFYALSAFVGAGLMFAGITNTCGMALLLARMPWNK